MLTRRLPTPALPRTSVRTGSKSDQMKGDEDGNGGGKNELCKYFTYNLFHKLNWDDTLCQHRAEIVLNIATELNHICEA